MAFIQITDTHFVPGDALLYDMSPRERLADGLALINARHDDAAFVLHTGDLVHHGELAAYETLRESLRACGRPVHLMMGNHDSRAPFRKAFPDAPAIAGGFVQFGVDVDGARLLCLDTLNDVKGDHIGMLCATRLRWLADEIAAIPAETPFLLAAHHPFFRIGVPAMDALTLQAPEGLWEVLQARKPDLFLFGHVHRPISGVYRGVPFHTQLGFNHQVALRFDETDELLFAEDHPSIAIIKRIDDGFAVYAQSVGGETRRFAAGEENRQSA